MENLRLAKSRFKGAGVLLIFLKDSLKERFRLFKPFDVIVGLLWERARQLRGRRRLTNREVEELRLRGARLVDVGVRVRLKRFGARLREFERVENPLRRFGIDRSRLKARGVATSVVEFARLRHKTIGLIEQEAP